MILTLMGTDGVSLERCSCTGRISLVIPVDGECCPGEGGCMTISTMDLSDYVPTHSAHVDAPVQSMFVHSDIGAFGHSDIRTSENRIIRKTEKQKIRRFVTVLRV